MSFCKFHQIVNEPGRFLCSECKIPSSRNKFYDSEGPPQRYCLGVDGKKQTVELGDKVEQVLTKFGITKERVEEWTGRPCNCDKRKEKLNQLDRWARKFFKRGRKKRAEEELEKLLRGE